MILTTEQAEAVCGAMCSLNNVGARVDAFLENEFHVRETPEGQIVVHKMPNTFPNAFGGPEIYDSQAAFAAAYGLQPRQPVAEVAEGFVFLLRKQPDGTRWPVGTKLYV